MFPIEMQIREGKGLRTGFKGRVTVNKTQGTYFTNHFALFRTYFRAKNVLPDYKNLSSKTSRCLQKYKIFISQ